MYHSLSVMATVKERVSFAFQSHTLSIAIVITAFSPVLNVLSYLSSG